MAKSKQITVEEKIISITHHNQDDYISLTDMVKGEEGSDHIRNWMRNRNSLEFIGIWEQINNPNFKGVEFDTFRKQAGLNSFNLTPKKWVEATGAIGVFSKAGRYGGTYAHRDIAFEFGSWISPTFKLYLIKEYQRLKEIESNEFNLEWNVKRLLAKVNYEIHTDAIKDFIVPVSRNQGDWEFLNYTEEADMLNVALFGMTAKEWRAKNPQRHLNDENIRDSASINELAVLSNLESINAEFIKSGIDKKTRFIHLRRIVHEQLTILNKKDYLKGVKKISERTYLDEKNERK